MKIPQMLFLLPAGQTEEPPPELMAAIQTALHDPQVQALADQCALKFQELVTRVGARHCAEFAAWVAWTQNGTPEEVLQQSHGHD